jgi:FtsP/CotA-like multicopper oxidase with cupredoxin domain
VRSFTLEVAPGETGAYTWAAPKPGTYLYQSGTMPSIQVPMGLYGALTVRSAANQAYPIPESVFDAERALLFSEIDPVQNGAWMRLREWPPIPARLTTNPLIS